MPGTLEERVAYLEGKVEEHSYAWQDLRERINHLDLKIDQRINHLEQKLDERFAQADTRINQMEQKIDQRLFQVDENLRNNGQRIDRLMFFIITTLVSSIGALIGVIISIFNR